MERCGVRKILDMVFATGAFNPSKEQETFALAHHDLDLQNLLTDEDGNITGIIDWDGSIAAPRCIGTAAVPIFLNRDWFPGYANTLSISPHLAWKTETYRQFYAQALVEAGHPDAKFTTKSPIYQAALCALYLGGSAHDFTEKLLREIPGFRLPPREMKVALGMGWEDGEKWLKGELRKILEPQMPVADPVELVGP
ncbi:hypothetical protein BDV95DRAFT_588256 [Massariosphaeria phaeospora]|uniref:Uncharacterized protein n=1 Tax=Massariosphaeria phaeospora TaxID=100035 RepID=A0A7C8HZS4_9PLEO|nr:hypothetical protein BDV95DRAFT_588256 [Massariosphaeria phaeospora]